MSVCLSVCLCVCVCVYPSDGIHVVACGPIGTKFCTHMQIHLQMVVSKIKISPVLSKGGLGFFRGSEIHKSGITTKRVDQLAPHLVRLKTISPSIPQGALGGGGLRDQKFKNLE